MSDDLSFVSRYELIEMITGLRARLAAVEQERDKLQRTFDLMWDADQRAIKRWQEAGEGRELTWPDRSKLTEWLLTERDAALADAKALRDALHTIKCVAAPNPERTLVDGASRDLSWCDDVARRALARKP